MVSGGRLNSIDSNMAPFRANLTATKPTPQNNSSGMQSIVNDYTNAFVNNSDIKPVKPFHHDVSNASGTKITNQRFLLDAGFIHGE